MIYLNTVKIISNDGLFARMLYLQICRFCSPADGDTADLYVVDADTTDKKYKPAVYFGRKDRYLYGIGDEEIFFHRPFDTEEFCLAVKDAVSPAEKRGLSVTGDSVYYNGERIRFTETEKRMFVYLFERRGTPVSRDKLKDICKRKENAADSNTCDVYIRMMRAKLDERFGVRIIRTVRGKGYVID